MGSQTHQQAAHTDVRAQLMCVASMAGAHLTSVAMLQMNKS